MRVKKKHQVLLLELIIAMILASSVLSTLTFFYFQMSQLNIEMDRIQNENFQRRYLESRLATLLPKIVGFNDASKDFHFFTSSDSGGFSKPGCDSLVFSFDNGVQVDRKFSYNVISRIFVDQSGNLLLVKWPAEKRWPENEKPPMTKELLTSGVEKLSFSFFVPPNPDALSHIPDNVRGEWLSSWNREYCDLPAILKIQVVRKNFKQEEETLLFAFPLPHTLTPITYGS